MERLFPEGTLKERLRVSAGNERVPAMGFLLVESAGCLAILEFIIFPIYVEHTNTTCNVDLRLI